MIPFTTLASSGLPDVDGVFLLKLLGIIAVALFIWNQAAQAFRKSPPPPSATPQPLIIAMKEEFVQIDEFHDLRHSLEEIRREGEAREDRLSAKLEVHWKELTRERSSSTARLHERIEAVHNTMRAEFDAKLKEVRDDVGKVPKEVIQILRDTGALERHK